MKFIGNIYTYSTTSFYGNHFGMTPPIHINRGTIQGDTFNPNLFIIFLEPLQDDARYNFNISQTTYSTTTYVDDLKPYSLMTSKTTTPNIQSPKIRRMGPHGPQSCQMHHHGMSQQIKTQAQCLLSIHIKPEDHLQK